VSDKTMATNAMDELLTKAIGARSMTEYAKSCGVSPMHVSRIKSGTHKPSKKICLKLSSDPYVKSIGLTSRDFLEAAGYTDENEIESAFTYEQTLAQQMDTIAYGLILKKLLASQRTYQIKSSNQYEDVDFEVHITDGDISSWQIVLDNSSRAKEEQARRVSFYYYLGRLLSFEADARKQYSMILSNDELYEELLKQVDKNMVKANVALAYFDAERMQILKESHYGEGEYISLVENN